MSICAFGTSGSTRHQANCRQGLLMPNPWTSPSPKSSYSTGLLDSKDLFLEVFVYLEGMCPNTCTTACLMKSACGLYPKGPSTQTPALQRAQGRSYLHTVPKQGSSICLELQVSRMYLLTFQFIVSRAVSGPPQVPRLARNPVYLHLGTLDPVV